MCSKMLLYCIMVKKTENKKEYYKNYRLKNIEKIKEYERKYYLERKNNEINRMKKIDEDIKKDDLLKIIFDEEGLNEPIITPAKLSYSSSDNN